MGLAVLKTPKMTCGPAEGGASSEVREDGRMYRLYQSLKARTGQGQALHLDTVITRLMASPWLP